jgi:hypothetical protein
VIEPYIDIYNMHTSLLREECITPLVSYEIIGRIAATQTFFTPATVMDRFNLFGPDSTANLWWGAGFRDTGDSVYTFTGTFTCACEIGCASF